ncbi:MAG: hypothetical protein LQ348_006259 [Seirophora lacunosa]|nr:MAG: hypothetical protein LQ348_006259 [Seirophora lacunosa]
MISTSPYDIIQAEPPKWLPQEEIAASAFIGITFFLVLETLFEIFRIFKKRQGLYFWCLVVGVVSCFVDAIGVTLKYLVPGSTSYWPLYTLMALSGWTGYTLCQLLVLYSRLHLLMDNHRVQRWVLYLICACAVCFNLPIWIVVWHAYNPDPELTRRWSPPDAIVERFAQIGHTLAECAVSGVYFHALWRLLKHKPTVRQRRVFLDLVYVNIATILFDVLTTIMVYLNLTGTSHPVQVFSYTLKFRLEFAVLNQLMAVAARGIHRETFGERRYYGTSVGDSSYYRQNHCMSELNKAPESAEGSGDSLDQAGTTESSKCETEITIPAPALEEVASKSRSRQFSGADSLISRQDYRTAKRDGTGKTGFGSKARRTARSLRPRSHHGWGDGTMTAGARSTRGSEQDDDDDEIPLHMWERNGELVMRIPWLPGNLHDQV